MFAYKSLLATFYIAYAAHASPFDRLERSRPLCFGHTFSNKELVVRPKQTVQKLQLKFYVEENGSPNSPMLKLAAQVKRPKGLRRYHQDMLCTMQAEQMQCAVECDGGQAIVNWPVQATNDQEIVFNNQGMVLYGGCENESNTVWLEPSAQGDDQFVLETMDCTKDL